MLFRSLAEPSWATLRRRPPSPPRRTAGARPRAGLLATTTAAVNLLCSLPFSSLVFILNCSISPPSKLGNCSAGYYQVLFSVPFPSQGNFRYFHVHFSKKTLSPSLSSRNWSLVGFPLVISSCICRLLGVPFPFLAESVAGRLSLQIA